MITAFERKVALVTGGGSGIGEACAQRLAELEATVVIADIDATAGRAVTAKINAAGGDAFFELVDVSVPLQVDSAVQRIAERHGALDILVNNAGIDGPMGPLADLSYADFRRVVDVDLGGVFSCMRAAIPAMAGAGGGVIVNVASVAGLVGFPMLAAYSAAKHAIVGLTKAAALEYGPAGIRVVAVAPSGVDTPAMRAIPEELKQAVAGAQAINRLAQPVEVAELVCFLASDTASFLTGSVHSVDGGYLAR